MNLRTSLVAALAATACNVTVPPQFSCPEPGKIAGCGSGEICGPDNLCTKVVSCLTTESRCSGVCTDVVSNREHCGDCNTTCAPSETCAAGKCQPFCAAGQTACAQVAGGFICENLSNDRINCGSCGNACGQGQVCTPTTPGGPGHCAVECLQNLTNCSGSCLDLMTDDASCGACGHSCATGTHCVGGSCKIICTPGQTLCTDTGGNTSCVDSSKDRDHCGADATCNGGKQCAAGEICSNGNCQLSCQAGLASCTVAGKFTCVNTAVDPNNCGGCGITCAAGQVCSGIGAGGAGVCILQCPSGETPLCGVPAWNAGTAYFTGNQVVNGADLYQCVTAGTSASSGGPTGTGTTIADGTAVWKRVSTAPTGPTQCINLESDRNNCGACDDATNSRACPDGEVCLGGACVVSCASGLTQCNGACVDTRNDPSNCGGCGVSCSAPSSAGPICGNGACGVSCPSGQIDCGGKCVDPQSDNAHCGAAGDCVANPGVACGQGLVCSQGGCKLLCPTASVQCGNKCVDPLHDNSNCGADSSCSGGVACGPGTACAPVSGVGQCVPTCGSGFSACGSVCKDTENDPLNCGACAKVCGPTGATAAGYDNGAAACVSSGCAAHCSGSFADCDGNLDDGCEADRAHDAANCGACGSPCNGATPYCTNGCVGAASAAGVQQNLAISIPATGAVAEWGPPCFSESYSHAGTTLAAIQAACTGTQVMVACAAGSALTLTAAAWGPRATVFGGGTVAANATFYAPGANTPAFGFTPPGAAVSFSTFDTADSSADAFTAGFGSQRLSWPVSSGGLDAGGRCGDHIGTAATSGDLRLFFSK
ncbi:MAG: hypothetical protein ABR567_19400 [Myxococcales bacterium]